MSHVKLFQNGSILKEIVLFHEYVRYLHKANNNVIDIPSAVKLVMFHLSLATNGRVIFICQCYLFTESTWTSDISSLIMAQETSKNNLIK